MRQEDQHTQGQLGLYSKTLSEKEGYGREKEKEGKRGRKRGREGEGEREGEEEKGREGRRKGEGKEGVTIVLHNKVSQKSAAYNNKDSSPCLGCLG